MKLRGNRISQAVALIVFTLIHGCGGAQVPPEAMPATVNSAQESDTGRKVIYSADLTIYVDDFSSVPEQIVKLAEQHKAFVADSSQDGYQGRSPSGQWKLRVPSEQYRSLLQDCGQLGDVVSQHETTQEVTEEYYDLTARLATKREEEQRLLEHLKVDTKELADILAVETELTRVRTEIEQLEGRQRFLDNEVALSTVWLRIEEVRNYRPQQQASRFGERMTLAWSQSLQLLGDFLQVLAICLVALIPWLAMLLMPVGLIIYLTRRFGPRKRQGP
ncbi:MAG: DUF4349 domain-containing protein [Planctomycetaceae bacterium]|nr:DUF4349 domain-containing protein [Planctomycetaceae bacterium]MCB9949810.1 DUF4349 domain-containing protein [Planctomycetaceae bacterium]